VQEVEGHHAQGRARNRGSETAEQKPQHATLGAPGWRFTPLRVHGRQVQAEL